MKTRDTKAQQTQTNKTTTQHKAHKTKQTEQQTTTHKIHKPNKETNKAKQ